MTHQDSVSRDNNSSEDFLFLAVKPRPLSRLTYKILSFNLLVVFVLAMGVSYLGNARHNLIESKLNNLEGETFLYVDLISMIFKGTQQVSSEELVPILEKLNFRNDQKILIYSPSGDIVADVGALPQRRTFGLQQKDDINLVEKSFLSAIGVLSVTFHLPPLPDLGDVQKLNSGEQSANIENLKIAAWSSEDGGLVLSSYSPIYKNGKPIAGLRVVRRDIEVEENFSETRLQVVRFLALAMLLTITHSLYLAGLIGHPLRKLATAAEAYRLSRKSSVEIPDMSDRQDEIGELSHAMREMTKSLQDRLSTIEQFSADVSHELKNPLTSLRSALETIPRVKNDEDRQRLMDIALHDLQRIDRLISDISQSTRLDVELSRNDMVLIDLRDILIPLIESHRDPLHRGTDNYSNNRVICNGLDLPVYIYGQIGRLEQVFQNLIGNALSFAPGNTQVIVSVDHNAERVKVIVDDSGPGIPENRLEKIFDRFYSERPARENFGMHSGLGLSIAKQIVDAHGGLITAENRRDQAGAVLGARFIVRLKSAERL
ncbi:MAG TPA: ATP-binding protein [Alphaproteobacteria bacterium]|nr:ATP-binding protein [Alphaproteobacteria bacterium]HNS43793.1 ATP-binding protein [Alphaproteobacteria bacterium]